MTQLEYQEACLELSSDYQPYFGGEPMSAIDAYLDWLEYLDWLYHEVIEYEALIPTPEDEEAYDECRKFILEMEIEEQDVIIEDILEEEAWLQELEWYNRSRRLGLI